MPTTLGRPNLGGWYKCFGEPQIEYFPNLAISSIDLSIRAGDPVMVGSAGTHTDIFVTASATNGANVGNTTLIMGWAMADLVYNGTTIAANSTQLPILMANEWTHVKVPINAAAAINTAATTWYVGKILQMSRAAATAVTDDAYYFALNAAATNTNGCMIITAFDRSTWPTFPTNAASDTYPFVWAKVIAGKRQVF